jgi:hypothetical protein
MFHSEGFSDRGELHLKNRGTDAAYDRAVATASKLVDLAVCRLWGKEQEWADTATGNRFAGEQETEDRVSQSACRSYAAGPSQGRTVVVRLPRSRWEVSARPPAILI